MINVIYSSMILLSIPTGLCRGTKSESFIFGMNEIEGNRSPAGGEAFVQMLPITRGSYLKNRFHYVAI